MWYEIVFVIEKMELETKMELLKLTDSYWDMLPAEIREIILEYRESQELIDRRESALNRALCKQIGLYGRLRQKWQVGHVQCRPKRCNPYVKCECMWIYGFYIDLRGMIHKCFLGLTFEQALANCDCHRIIFGRIAFENIRLYDVNGINEIWVLGRFSSRD